MRRLLGIALAISLASSTVGAFGARASEKPEDTPSVNYISADAVYLNVGTRAGLTAGARVELVRGGKTIAVLKVVHVSSHSAACHVVEQSQPPRVGDQAVFAAVSTPSLDAGARPQNIRASPAARPDDGEGRTINVVSGHVQFQHVWQKDLTGSSLNSLQPAVFARITVKNVAGTGGEIRFRDRIRYYHRDQTAGATIDQGEWYHRLTEMAFLSGTRDDNVAWGVGRLITPYMMGVGLVDGGFVSVRFAQYLRAGAAAGFAPGAYDLSFSTDNTQAGGFLAFEYEAVRQWHFASSAALAGQYKTGTVSREFLYWQNVFNYYRRFSVFQTVEIDLNRDWRHDAAGEAATFSNFYITASADVAKNVSVDFSYDSRKNVRTYETKETPDSLFDDLVHDGFRGGFNWRLPRGVTLRGYGGMRYRDSDRTNRYFSLYARASQLRWRGHSVWVRYALAETRTVTGHRPALEYRFPAGRRTRVNLGTGGYIYRHGTRTTSSAYGDLGVTYSIDRYFASGKYRQYVGGDLESILLFLEFGLRF